MSKDSIYAYLKNNIGVKFKIRHLAKLFDVKRKGMDNHLIKMYKNKGFYPGFDREETTDIATVVSETVVTSTIKTVL